MCYNDYYNCRVYPKTLISDGIRYYIQQKHKIRMKIVFLIFIFKIRGTSLGFLLSEIRIFNFINVFLK